jgi:hypothetical protein
MESNSVCLYLYDGSIWDFHKQYFKLYYNSRREAKTEREPHLPLLLLVRNNKL